MAQVLAFQELTTSGRRMRRPEHSFQLRQKPWVIQPFLIAPVLPGETLKNLLLQARIVTDPIKNPLIGWWAEYYLFYVKHRDLTDRDTFTAMVLDPEYDTSALNTAAKTATYHFGSTIDWTTLCLERVVEEYFRNEGEAWDDYLIDTMPISSVNRDSWLDSVANDAAFASGPGGADDQSITVGGDGLITASEIDTALRTWQWLRANNLTQQTYEEFLRTYGVVKKDPVEESHKPELLRYVREWSYPVNTVDPSTGSPSSAVSWAVAERADKARFFSEPGFVFGVSVVRPKVYFKSQSGSCVGLLTDAISWLPAVLNDDPFTSVKKVANGAGPLPNNADADGYWVDVRDLFTYGDQFVNFALTATDAGIVALPTTALQKRYVASTDIDALFDDAAGGKNLVRQDGIVSLHVAGHQQDRSDPV